MTPRIPTIDDNTTTPARETLEQVGKAVGMVPNLHRTLAHAPAVLKAYVQQVGTLSGGRLAPALREQLALVTAGRNGCTYCASAHTLLGKGAGVAEDELARNLLGESTDPRTAAALTFARALLDDKGAVSDEALQAVRDAGFDEGEIIEIVAHVGLNTFTNMVNELARTEIDFPRVDLPVAV